ncbi:hypothetical protein F2Q69_00035627 [Brassica cretica]|uniref:Uncharacterized protein n=1 Tax=Brassica cretica TaxID=69181 RepID=A0A8S9SU38_BRACR|nr:hypothetical protein F2Q69_00035627 [Brassica cretica]
MGDNSSSSTETAATLAQLLAAVQSISERMTRFEQGQQAQANNWNNNQQQQQENPKDGSGTDSDIPSLEEEDHRPPPRRNARNRGRNRGRDYDQEEERPWLGGKDLKLKPPTFAGKVNVMSPILDRIVRMGCGARQCAEQVI